MIENIMLILHLVFFILLLIGITNYTLLQLKKYNNFKKKELLIKIQLILNKFIKSIYIFIAISTILFIIGIMISFLKIV